MNKKIFAIIFSALLLCSCGKGNAGEQPEAASESVTSASETTVTTTAAETTAEAVSEETEIVTEVSAAEEKVPITRDFFNDDVVFEEVMLPVKVTHYDEDGTEYLTQSYEYDEAGNRIKWIVYMDYPYERTYEYDYNPDGTYNSVFEYRDGEIKKRTFYDKNGYCLGDFPTENKYEFDGSGRLIRKENSYEFYEYSYDESGRLYEESRDDELICKHEYGDGFENVYWIDEDNGEQILCRIIEKDENGNTIKGTYNVGDISDDAGGKRFAEYKYDSLNRLIYENHTVSEDFYIGNDATYEYLRTYEYEGDKLKKQTYSYYFGTESQEYFYNDGRLVKEVHIYDGEPDDMNGFLPMEYTTEYFYNDDGSIISQTHDTDGVLIEEAEYAMIPKIKTDIEYKNFYEVNP